MQPEYKQNDDIQRLIKKGKPFSVVEKFARDIYYSFKEQEWKDEKKAEYEALVEAQQEDEAPLPSFEDWLVEAKPEPLLDENGEPVVTTHIDEDGNEVETTMTIPVRVREFECDWSEFDVSDLRKDIQLGQIQKQFAEKYEGLKRIAADKKGSAEYVNAQSEVYEKMYELAKKGVFDDETNQAIIAANETAKQQLAFALLMLNEVRSYLQKRVEAGEDVEQEIHNASKFTRDKLSLLNPDDGIDANIQKIVNVA